MARYAADISPAIRELKKLHLALLDVAVGEAQADEGGLEVVVAGVEAARNTVISVVPGDRRRELGWYRFQKWESRTSNMLEQMDPSLHSDKYHEIFIAGEALKNKPEEIVLLMMHQIAHQASGTGSTQSYHADWLKFWMHRLFKIDNEAFKREAILGWTVKFEDLSDESKTTVRALAHRIRAENMDLFRQSKEAVIGSGKMYLWHCEGCAKPIKVRTGGILQATCDLCQGSFKIKQKLVPPHFLDRVPLDLRG